MAIFNSKLLGYQRVPSSDKNQNACWVIHPMKKSPSISPMFFPRRFSTMFGMVKASLLAKDFPFGSHLLEQFVIFAWLSQ